MANKNISINSSTKNLSLPSVSYTTEDIISLRPTEAGIYSFEIFGSSGSGAGTSGPTDAGSGGGGGCYSYFKLKLGTFEQVGIGARNFIDISFPSSENATWTDIILDGISVLSNIGSCNFKLTAFAGKNGNVRTGGYLSFANSEGDPDNNNNNLFVSYHSSSGGDGAEADEDDIDINNLQSFGSGGSGGKDSSETEKGYPGGAGKIILGKVTLREAGAGQQGKIVINYIEPIEIEPETPPDSGGTTDPETPPSGTDPEIPNNEIEIVEYENSSNTIDLKRMQNLADKLYKKIYGSGSFTWDEGINSPVKIIDFNKVNQNIDLIQKDYETGNTAKSCTTNWNIVNSSRKYSCPSGDGCSTHNSSVNSDQWTMVETNIVTG